MRPYIFDENTQAKIDGLRHFAEQTKNWYVVGKSKCPPGDLPGHVLVLEVSNVRVVFSITVMESPAGTQTYRHASFSLPEPLRDRTPNPIAIFTICHALGFTGGEVAPSGKDAFEVVIAPAGEWQQGVSDGVVVIAQPLNLEAMVALADAQVKSCPKSS